MWGIDQLSSLNIATVATIFTIFGAVCGSLLNNYVLPQFVDQRKQKQELTALYEKYRAPLRFSTHELTFRMFSIIEETPKDYLKSAVLNANPSRLTQNSRDDPYYQRYKLVSSIYRFCAFLGWLELYRQETTYLRPLNVKNTRLLEEAIDHIRSDLADRTPGTSAKWNTWVDRFHSTLEKNHPDNLPDWATWTDVAIYREEIRAIGESMIEVDDDKRSVMGYARFSEIFESGEPSSTYRWSKVVSNLLLDLGASPKDFRNFRIQLFAIDLVDLMKVLGSEPVDERLLDRRDALSSHLSSPTALAQYLSEAEVLNREPEVTLLLP